MLGKGKEGVEAYFLGNPVTLNTIISDRYSYPHTIL